MKDDGKPEVLTVREAVRKRPGMYFGFIGAGALEHIVEELVSNAVDQFLAGHATRVAVQLAPEGIAVSDDGSGFPLDEPAGLAALLTMHDRPTADGHAPHVHVQGFLGVGLCPIAAASERLTIRAWRSGRLWETALARGVVTDPPHVVADGNGRGTTVTVLPDPQIFGGAQVRPSVLRGRLFQVAHLFPGLRVHAGEEVFHAPGGLADFVFIEAGSLSSFHALRVPFSVTCQADKAWIVAAATDDGRRRSDRTQWRSWVNGCETPEHGSHVDGFKNALRAAGWKPCVAAIHVTLSFPRYDSPTRGKLGAPFLRRVIENALSGPLDEYLAVTEREYPGRLR